jgi:hypothetical protein
MAVLLMVLAVGRWRYIDGLDSDVNQAAARAFFDIIGRYLRAAIRLIALLGLVVAGIALVTRPRGSVSRVRVVTSRWLIDARRVGQRGWARLDQPWIERNRAVLLGALVAVFCLLVITPDRVTQSWGRAVLLATVIGFALIWLTTRSATPLLTVPAGATMPVSAVPVAPQPYQSTVNGETERAGVPTAVAPKESLAEITRNLSVTDLELLVRIAGALRDTGRPTG